MGLGLPSPGNPAQLLGGFFWLLSGEWREAWESTDRSGGCTVPGGRGLGPEQGGSAGVTV